MNFRFFLLYILPIKQYFIIGHIDFQILGSLLFVENSAQNCVSDIVIYDILPVVVVSL